jgi:hypothetical protein
MNKLMFGLALLMVIRSQTYAQTSEKQVQSIRWHNLQDLNVEGRGWDNRDNFYCRLPAKAQAKVNGSLWRLAGHSAGMVARFVTDSPEIQVRWKVTRSSPLPVERIMAPTGVSGVDLYVRFNGKWRWLAIGIPTGRENESTLVSGLPREKREYALYLPLYNGVTSVELGVMDEADLAKAPPRTRNTKPVVFYGSSIMQGASASRPGMAYPALIGRWLDIPTINLGFAGAGKCEHEVADLLAELDPQVYVIDCLPNMEPSYVDERTRYLLKVLKEKHPNTPVILVENVVQQNLFIRVKNPAKADEKSAILKKVYQDVVSDWNGRLFYVENDDRLYGNDGEASVDGVHATDVGFMRMANVINPVIEKALDIR